MLKQLAMIAVGFAFVPGVVPAQGNVTLKTTVVALTATPAFRKEFEDGLVAKAREHAYNVVPSYEVVPNVTDVDNRNFVDRLLDAGIGAVLMISPASVGPDASLESVRDRVSPETYENMRAFARLVGRHRDDEILSVVHLGIYLLSEEGAERIGSGAVWLDEPNPSRADGIDRLQNLILANVDGVRPAIRAHLGMPPLQQ